MADRLEQAILLERYAVAIEPLLACGRALRDVRSQLQYIQAGLTQISDIIAVSSRPRAKAEAALEPLMGEDTMRVADEAHRALLDMAADLRRQAAAEWGTDEE